MREKDSSCEGSGPNAERDLTEAKARFMNAACACEPLGIVKRNRLKSVGLAFLTGACITGLMRKSAVLALLPPLAQTGTMLARYGIARLMK